MEKNIELVQKMIELTIKKQEALEYLCNLLADNRADNGLDYNKWYYDRKHKIDSAILKVDIEFLEVYHLLLEKEQVNSIGELPKDRFGLIKLLQEEITKTKSLENQIQEGELALMAEKGQNHMSNDVKVLKHLAPRANKAYKKNKK